MSAQAGILYDDRRPVELETLQALSRWNAELGADSAGQAVRDGVALLHFGVHFDALSTIAQQPVASPDGSLVTFDGRLDNREDLLISLRHDIGQPHPTDADLVALAFRKWSLDALPLLIGDWSLAHWNPATETVTLACDYMGVLPLHFARRDGLTVWSTCLETIVSMFNLYDELDERHLAGVLTLGPSADSTFFAGVSQVRPAQMVSLRRGRAPAAHPFWNYQPDRIRYRDRRQYEEHFRYIFRDAVRTRLRASGPVWSELSGGLDSSSIVCMASQLVERGEVPTPSLRAMSQVFPHSPESDETPFIEAVERWTGVTSTRITDDVPEPDVDVINRGFRPLNSTLTLEQPNRLLQESGGRVLLSGEIGDLVFGKNSGHRVSLLEHLETGHPLRFIAGCVHWSKRTRRPLAATTWALLTGLLPASLDEARFYRRALSLQATALKTPTRDLGAAFGLAPDFVRRTNYVPEQAAGEIARFPPSKRFLLRGLYRWTSLRMMTNLDTMGSLRKTYPLAHRPLVEFVVAIPETILWEPGTPRPLLRRSLRDLLPPEVLNRQFKGYASPAANRLVRNMAVAIRAESSEFTIIERGYVLRDVFNSQMEGLLDGSQENGAVLQSLLALEVWLRRRKRTSPSLSPGNIRAAVAPSAKVTHFVST